MRTFYLSIALVFLGLHAAFAQEEAAEDSLYHIESLDLDNLQNIVSEIREENLQLQERLQALEGDVTNENFNKIIKSANKEKFISDINILQKRFEAGENVLYHIIKETNNFNLSYKHLVLQNQFNTLLNPMNYPSFTTPLKTTMNSLGDKKPLNIEEDISNLSGTVPYLANPVINSGISIATYFLARFNKKSKVDNANFEKMMCVLNFTATAENHYNLNVNTVESLSNKIDNFNLKLKAFFDLYLKSIGYSEGYDAYIDRKGTEGNDFLRPTRESFFNDLLSDTTNIGIINFVSDNDDNVSYYIEQVKFQLNEYEALLLDIENSIMRYEEFVNDISNLADKSCEGVRTQTQASFNSIKENVSGVKKAFYVVNKENRVPASLKKTLFGL